MSFQQSAAPAARWIARLGRLFCGSRRAAREEPARWAGLIARVRARRLTYCGPPKLETICQTIDRLHEQRIRGCYVEAGCALGGSAIVIGTLKPREAPFYVFDAFGMIPPPGANDGPDSHARYAEIASGRSAGIQGDPYYGYLPNLREVVEQNLRSFGLDLAERNIQLIPGLFAASLQVAEPIALAHIDCDWYDSVLLCIERLAPRMVPGGAMVFDDYSSYAGCRRAVDAWLATTSEFRLAHVNRSATIERIGGKAAAKQQKS
jgi:hypothetical protein